MIHGFYCNTTTFPTKCRYCGEAVFFFSCDCGSKVFFDELGPPWPIHNCFGTGNTIDNRPSSLPSIRGVNIIRGSTNSNLLPGPVHVPQQLQASVTRRLRESRHQVREIMRIEPLGSRPVEAIGAVQDRLRPNLTRRLGLEQGTVGYAHFVQQVGEMDLEQVTVLVDELANDADAIDLLSYTFLCNRRALNRGITKGAVVRVSLRKVEVIGVKPFWYASDIEQLA